MNRETIWEIFVGKRKRNKYEKFAERMQILLFMLCCVDVLLPKSARAFKNELKYTLRFAESGYTRNKY